MKKPLSISGTGFIFISMTLIVGCVPQPDSSTELRPQPAEETGHEEDTGARPARSDDWFEEVTRQTGIDFTPHTGRSARHFTILETVGTGVGLVDYDRDTHADLLVLGGGEIDPQTSHPSGQPSLLFRHTAAWQFIDVSAAARVPATDYSHGCVSNDLDNDGFPELLITCYGRLTYLHNLGDGTFADATESAGLTSTAWHTGVACGDINGDGLLDIYIANYVDWHPDPTDVCPALSPEDRDVCPPQKYLAQRDNLYLNQGDGRFTEAAKVAGIRSEGKGLGVLIADFNDDGRVDVYVANDVVANHLYLGGNDLPLREVGEQSGTAYNEAGSPEGSMGVATGDINGDSRLDLWVTNFELEDNSLYQGLGSGQFQHMAVRYGLGGIGRPDVGFGTGLHDFNSDGWLDIYILNGHVKYKSTYSPFRQSSYLLLNESGLRFSNSTEQAGPWFSRPHVARGCAAGDLDGDGAVDLVISCLDEPLAILRNRLEPANWGRLQLVGTTGPRDPIGAKVVLKFKDRMLTRVISSGSGYLSQSDPRLSFAAPPDAPSVDVVVTWPSGRRELFDRVVLKQEQILTEGRGTPLLSADQEGT